MFMPALLGVSVVVRGYYSVRLYTFCTREEPEKALAPENEGVVERRKLAHSSGVVFVLMLL